MPAVVRWLAATIALAAILAGCQAGEPVPQEFRVVGSSPPGSPWANQWRQFDAALAAQPRLALRPSLYVQGQLGDSERTIQALRRGRVQMGGFPISAAAALVPEIALLHLPFIFGSEAEVDHVIDGYLQSPLNELFEAQGVTVLSWTEAGYNHLFSTSAILQPGDLAGYPIRAQPTPASRVLFGELGADVRPLPYSELLSGLQTGLVRAGDGNLVLYFAGGIAKEAPHLTLTAHAFEAGLILANRAWWQGLSGEQREAIRGALGPREQLRGEVAELAASLLERARSEGDVEVHRLDAASRDEWRRATAGVRARLVRELGGEAARIDALLEEGRQSFARRNPAG